MQPSSQQPTIQPNYDFITNPSLPPKRTPSIGGSMLSRILITGVGLLILLILFIFIKGIVTGGGNKAAMLNVVQYQQQIIHVTTVAGQEQSISAANKTAVVSTGLVITSQQAELLQYLSSTGQKITLKQKNLKVSTKLDKQLTDSLASGTYDSTLQSILSSELTNYSSALKLATAQTGGPKGKKLLNNDYTSANLLLTQLQQASSSAAP